MIYAREQGRAAHQILILAADLTRERESLRASLVESQRILALRNFDRAQTAFEKDQVALGLHWMLASWRSARDANDPAWQRVALANLSAWCPSLPRLQGVLSHEGPVDAAAFHPDGNAILTGGDDGMARLWNAETAEPVGQPLRHPGTVYAVAFSPDGKTALTGSRDRTARLWDAATGQPIGPSLPHSGQIWSVAFASDGQTFLTGDISNTARVFSIVPAFPDDPDQVATRLERLTGLRLEPTQGHLLVLDNAAWRATYDRSKAFKDRSSREQPSASDSK